ncbi:MAG: hypothetical protein A3H32_01145 [Betaproteobacteria bacterium RIFCSPLOWO2_02_FULL_63_19]|nr:MAG: hypothetical protein A3H32_01145 [Betaproteobacteria bacterium RIFCSPLOWO2_02_FULL_63_19]
MKRLWWLFAAGLFLLALIVQWPAAWLAPRIEQATQQRWRLGSVRGTVWRGQAVLYSLDRSSGRWHPGRRIHWDFVWGELLRGRLAVQTGLGDAGRVRLAAGPRSWSIEELDATMPAEQIAVLLPATLADYGWSGPMHARAQVFSCQWGRAGCVGRIDLSWTKAAVAYVPGPPLGDYQLRLTAEGKALRFDLATVRGRLRITGAGELSGGALRFTGEAWANGEHAGNLETILQALGRPGAAPGRYLIEYREKIR